MLTIGQDIISGNMGYIGTEPGRLYRMGPQSKVAEASGEPPVVLPDCKKKPLKGLTIYGKSTQVTTTGAQLLDQTKATVNGWNIKYDIPLEKSKTYTFTNGEKAANPVGLFGVNPGEKDELLSNEYLPPKGSYTFTCAKDYATILLGGSDGKTVFDGRYMLNAGSTPLPWEPYTGGVPSPSPDYPQEIESVGQDGEIGVEVYGGNMFNARTAINGKVVDKHTGSMLSNSRYACSDYIAIPCNAVSLYQNGGTKNQRAFYDSDKNFITAEVSVNPVTVPKNAKYIRITSEIDKQDMNNIMLSISSTALLYEPYHEPQFASIATPNGLPGIPVSSGGNYTAANGQQWICDEIDFGRGVYVQNIKVSKSLNKLRWSTWGVNKSTNGITGFFTYDIDIPKIGEAVSNITLYNEDIHGGKRTGICASTIKPTSMTPYMILCVCNDTISDISSDNAAIQSFKEMLAETDAYMMYVLATPIETPLTADQLNAYKALRIYKGTTIIDNDAGAYMSVKYNT